MTYQSKRDELVQSLCNRDKSLNQSSVQKHIDQLVQTEVRKARIDEVEKAYKHKSEKPYAQANYIYRRLAQLNKEEK